MRMNDQPADIGARPLTPHDPLTGFGNRRKLLTDLEHALAAGSAPSLLAIFDLGGFKQYQRVCGHQAGDHLIRRASAVFSTAIGAAGSCYRPREDEFVVLIDGTLDSLEPLLTAAARALRQEGEAFLITSSYGTAQLPDEADQPITALALADQRLGVITNRPPRERRQHPRNRDEQAAPSSPRRSGWAGLVAARRSKT
jgi:diguanylate cyclase (GGDEF)-like protein